MFDPDMCQMIRILILLILLYAYDDITGKTKIDFTRTLNLHAVGLAKSLMLIYIQPVTEYTHKGYTYTVLSC